jgi:hypothetical protein
MIVADALLYECERNLSVFYAGGVAPRGSYVNLESGHVVDLYDNDVLPASLDGHVAAYVSAPPAWGDSRRCLGSKRN